MLALHWRTVSASEAGSLPVFFTGVAGWDSSRSVSLFRLSSFASAVFMYRGVSGPAGGGGAGGWPHSSLRFVGVLSASGVAEGVGGAAKPEMPSEWARERKEGRAGPATDTSPV